MDVRKLSESVSLIKSINNEYEEVIYDLKNELSEVVLGSWSYENNVQWSTYHLVNGLSLEIDLREFLKYTFGTEVEEVDEDELDSQMIMLHEGYEIGGYRFSGECEELLEMSRSW